MIKWTFQMKSNKMNNIRELDQIDVELLSRLNYEFFERIWCMYV